MIYNYEILKVDGGIQKIEDFKNKVLLIVNIATHCGYTKQLTDLEVLYEKYHDKGLEIIAIPSNQFMNQAKGSDEEIVEFCQLNYKTTFPVYAKALVNGKNAIPLYKFLKEKTDVEKIRWNFVKFLVDKNGEIIKHYDSKVKPLDLEEEIINML